MNARMRGLFEAIHFIREVKNQNAGANKAALQDAYCAKFDPARMRSVFVGGDYAFRFSEANTGSFSNTVLSLSALQQHDARPFVVIVSRAQTVDFLLANSTFLKKISHSSHHLRVDNVKGSFNGTDIMTEYEGQPNAPENFPALFAQHSAFTWEENLERLVEATNAIVARNIRFAPNQDQQVMILDAPLRAQAALESPAFLKAEEELQSLVEAQSQAILELAQLDNVNLRGNAIEQLITGVGNAHELGDLARDIDGGLLVIDVKTKLLDRASAPKAYNVDKMLTFLSEPGSVFAFFMIGVDTQAGIVSGRLLPVLERSLLDATVVQHHWAGRGSRGVTQLSGRFGEASRADYRPSVDIERAQKFLKELLAL